MWYYDIDFVHRNLYISSLQVKVELAFVYHLGVKK